MSRHLFWLRQPLSASASNAALPMSATDAAIMQRFIAGGEIPGAGRPMTAVRAALIAARQAWLDWRARSHRHAVCRALAAIDRGVLKDLGLAEIVARAELATPWFANRTSSSDANRRPST